MLIISMLSGSSYSLLPLFGLFTKCLAKFFMISEQKILLDSEGGNNFDILFDLLEVNQILKQKLADSLGNFSV